MLGAIGVTLATLFLFGTFWFWMLVVLVALLIAAEVHFDQGSKATATLIITVVFLHFFSGINILQYAFNNLGWFLGGSVLYLLVGAGYSVLKLELHTRNLNDKYQRAKVQFLRDHKLPDDAEMKDLKQNIRAEWEGRVESYLLMDLDKRDGSVTFDLHRRRATVIMWIGHWPFSLLATLLNDPVKRAINFLYERMVVFYEAIIARNLGNRTKGDVLTHKEEDELRTAVNKGRSTF